MTKLRRRITKGSRLVVNRLREQGPRVTFLWLLEHAIRIATGAPRRATSVISPGLIVGGQYRRRGWPRLTASGVTGVLNLRAEYCDSEAGIAPGNYLRLPTADDESPSVEQLQEGVRFIEQEVGRGGGVYIHCGAGVGRAATMAAAYLVAQGAQPDEAWDQIRRVRPFIRPTLQQRKGLEEWATRCRDDSGGLSVSRRAGQAKEQASRSVL